jgi:5-enolpyruvylshikimate-3-phosphate synthase
VRDGGYGSAVFATGVRSRLRRFCFDADEQLRGRPMAALVRVLVGLGANVTPPSSVAFPFELEAAGLRGGEVVVDGSASSQFLSDSCWPRPTRRTRSPSGRSCA